MLSFFSILFTVLLVFWPTASRNCLNEGFPGPLPALWLTMQSWALESGFWCVYHKRHCLALAHLIESIPFCPEVFLPTRSRRIQENSFPWPIPHHKYGHTPKVIPFFGWMPGALFWESPGAMWNSNLFHFSLCVESDMKHMRLYLSLQGPPRRLGG